MTIAEFFKQHFINHNFQQWIQELLLTRLSTSKNLMENLINLLEQEDVPGEETENIMVVDDSGNLESINVDDIKTDTAAAVADNMREVNIVLQQLFYLGLDDEETLINKGKCNAAQVMQFILEKKLALLPQDKDMIVMMHEIEYELNGAISYIKSFLVLKGDDAQRTAMAKTVGLPLGIAAKLILENKLNIRGLHIPVSEEIYKPVLAELAKNGIVFTELR